MRVRALRASLPMADGPETVPVRIRGQGVAAGSWTRELREIATVIAEFADTLDGVQAALLFGSRARGKTASDIDFKIFVRRDPSDGIRRRCSGFARWLHRRFAPEASSGPRDVPFSRKTIIGPSVMAGLWALEPFRSGANGLRIPPIPAGAEFLTSDVCQMRTVLNALTSPHLLIVGDPVEHRRICKRAFGRVLHLVETVYQLDRCDLPTIRSHLLRSPSGLSAKDYLGYSDEPIVVRWLEEQWRRVVREPAA